MTSEMVCPICNRERIPADRTQCPQCDADLTCFKVLASLPDEPLREKTGTRKQVLFISALGVFLGLVTALSVFQVYRFKRVESRISAQETYLMDAMMKVRTQLEHLAHDQPRPALGGAGRRGAIIETKDGIQEIPVSQDGSVHPTPLQMGVQGAFDSPPGKGTEGSVQRPLEGHPGGNTPLGKMEFWIYEANERDTLWGIAKRYYGSGQYYPVLLEHNPHLDIYDIGDGVRIRILKDARLANEIYQRITEREGNKVYWSYTVVQGDTPRSIAGRFYKSEDMVKRVIDPNPGMQFRPGERIRILLQ